MVPSILNKQWMPSTCARAFCEASRVFAIFVGYFVVAQSLLRIGCQVFCALDASCLNWPSRLMGVRRSLTFSVPRRQPGEEWRDFFHSNAGLACLTQNSPLKLRVEPEIEFWMRPVLSRSLYSRTHSLSFLRGASLTVGCMFSHMEDGFCLALP